MPVVAVVTSSPPGAEGGHMVMARALVNAARGAGYDARLIVTPDYGFGRLTRSYLASRRLDVNAAAGARVDRVVSLRYPSYAVHHRAHVCWLNHTMREYYDLWPQFSSGLSWKNRIKERMRRTALHAVDRRLLTRNVNHLFTISATVSRRLAVGLGIGSEPLHPPAPPRPYRCEEYGDFVFAVSRITPLKRVDLLVRALAEPAAQHVRAVIAGDGDAAVDLERLARDLGVSGRVTLLGHADDAVLLDCFARCRAVCFTPHDEDYGFVTVEAFASRKGVITCRDSGGPTELVTDGATGLVCEPTAAAVAAALARVMDDRAFAERMGAAGHEASARMTWTEAVGRIVG